MVSCEHFIAKPDELLASVLAAHSNVGILQTQSKGVRKPAVGILSCHDPGLPDAVKLPVRLDAQVPEVSVRRHAHRLIGAGMRCHIGVARGVVVTDIEFPIVLAVAEYAGLKIMAAPQWGQRKGLLRWARVFLFFKMVISFFAFY